MNYEIVVLVEMHENNERNQKFVKYNPVAYQSRHYLNVLMQSKVTGKGYHREGKERLGD